MDSGLSNRKSFIMGLVYSLTTPVGIAIGERPAGGAVCVGVCVGGGGGCQWGPEPAAAAAYSCAPRLGALANHYTLAPARSQISPTHPSCSSPPGIGVYQSFNSNDTTTLMVQGIFDSISTGILIYVALVELISPMFTQVGGQGGVG